MGYLVFVGVFRVYSFGGSGVGEKVRGLPHLIVVVQHQQWYQRVWISLLMTYIEYKFTLENKTDFHTQK